MTSAAQQASRENLLALVDELTTAYTREGDRGPTARVAELFGVSPSYLSRLRSGSITDVSDDVARRIQHRTTVNARFIMENPGRLGWRDFPRVLYMEGRDATVRQKLEDMEAIAFEAGDAPTGMHAGKVLSAWRHLPGFDEAAEYLAAWKGHDTSEQERLAPGVVRGGASLVMTLRGAFDREQAEAAKARIEFERLFPNPRS